jgi:hypothetical protein
LVRKISIRYGIELCYQNERIKHLLFTLIPFALPLV